MGSLADQIHVYFALADYERAQRAADLCPDVSGQVSKADRLFFQLSIAAFACGYAPGREHRNVSIHEFAKTLAARTAKSFPLNLKEALASQRLAGE